MYLVLLEKHKKFGHRFIVDRLRSFLARYLSVKNTQCQKFLSLALNTFLVKIPGMFARKKNPLSKKAQKPLILLLIGKEQKRLRSKRNINK